MVRQTESRINSRLCFFFPRGILTKPERSDTDRVRRRRVTLKLTAKNCLHLGARDFRMILCKRNAGNSLHIGKFRLRESAGKNCSEAGPDRSCPARVTLCAACSAPLTEYVRRIRFISRVEHAPHEPSWYAKARIRAHLDILTSCSGFGHLRPSKLPCPHIRKNATCNPSARFGEQRIVDR